MDIAGEATGRRGFAIRPSPLLPLAFLLYAWIGVINRVVDRCSSVAVWALIRADLLLMILAVTTVLLVVATGLTQDWATKGFAGRAFSVVVVLFSVGVPIAFCWRLAADIGSEQRVAQGLLRLGHERLPQRLHQLEALCAAHGDTDYRDAARSMFYEELEAVRASSGENGPGAPAFLAVLRDECVALLKVVDSWPRSRPGKRRLAVALADLVGGVFDEVLKGSRNPEDQRRVVSDYAVVAAMLVDRSVASRFENGDGAPVGFAQALGKVQSWGEYASSSDWGSIEIQALLRVIEQLDRSISPDMPERFRLIDQALELGRICAADPRRKAAVTPCLQFVGDRLKIEDWSDEELIGVVNRVAHIAAEMRATVGSFSERQPEVLLRYIMDLSKAAGRRALTRKAAAALRDLHSPLAAPEGVPVVIRTTDLRPYLEWLAENLGSYRYLRRQFAVAKQQGMADDELRSRIPTYIEDRQRLLRIAQAKSVPPQAQSIHARYLTVLERGISALDAFRRGDEAKFERLSDQNTRDFAAVCRAYEDVLQRHAVGPPLNFEWRHLR